MKPHIKNYMHMVISSLFQDPSHPHNALRLVRRAMAPKTASQLRDVLSSHGETAPRRWSKVELLQRVEEVTGVDYTKPQPKEKSEYKILVTALNQAAARKATLQVFCRQHLNMEVNLNLTIAQLQKEALSVIYGKAAPDPTDLVGFGAWVIQTAKEGQCNPRLRRLAGWLSNDPVLVKRAQEEFMVMGQMKDKAEVVGYPHEPTTPRGTMTSTRTSKAAASSSGGAENEDTVTVGTEVLSNLVQTIELLKMEVAALKGERPRKKASAEDNDSVTSFSMAGSL
eukprot:s267_g13.t1